MSLVPPTSCLLPPIVRAGAIDACVVCPETADLDLCHDCGVACYCSAEHFFAHKELHFKECESIRYHFKALDNAARVRAMWKARGKEGVDENVAWLQEYHEARSNQIWLRNIPPLLLALAQLPTRKSITWALYYIGEVGHLDPFTPRTMMQALSYCLRVNDLDSLYYAIREATLTNRFPLQSSDDAIEVIVSIRCEAYVNLFEDIGVLVAASIRTEFAIMMMLVLIRLLYQLEILHEVAQCIGPKVPREILDKLLDDVVTVPAIARDPCLFLANDHSARILQLRTNIMYLFLAVHSRDQRAWGIVLRARDEEIATVCPQLVEDPCSPTDLCCICRERRAWNDTPEALSYLSSIVEFQGTGDSGREFAPRWRR